MMYTAISFAAYGLVVGALFVLRRRLGVFGSAFAFSVLSLVYLRFGFAPPLPRSILIFNGGVLVVAVLLYVTSSEAGREAFWNPIRALMVERRRRPLLIALLAVIPGVVAWQSYAASLPSKSPPPMIRSIHPSPPAMLSFMPPGAEQAKEIALVNAENPHRKLEQTNPGEFRKKVGHGKTVYYENCFYCHGDKLMADGHLAAAISPPPAKFSDEVLPMFEETFFFWRIANGGPGLPDEGTPWDSVMPVWQKMLSEDDIWSVILYLYDRQALRPRTPEAAAGGGH